MRNMHLGRDVIELQNDYLGKSLHGVLYNRFLHFAQRLTPEIPAEEIITIWLNRFYLNDPFVKILVELDEQYRIVAHAVFEIQRVANVTIVACHQYESDKPSVTRLDELIAYGRDLRSKSMAHCGTFMVEKGVKAYEKRYGFKTVRTIMLDHDGDVTGVVPEGKTDG